MIPRFTFLLLGLLTLLAHHGADHHMVVVAAAATSRPDPGMAPMTTSAKIQQVTNTGITLPYNSFGLITTANLSYEAAIELIISPNGGLPTDLSSTPSVGGSRSNGTKPSIGPSLAAAMTTPAPPPCDIRYDIIKPATYGVIQKLRGNGRWATVSHFTQRQINRSKVRYLHIKDKPTGDSIELEISCSDQSLTQTNGEYTFTRSHDPCPWSRLI